MASNKVIAKPIRGHLSGMTDCDKKSGDGVIGWYTARTTRAARDSTFECSILAVEAPKLSCRPSVTEVAAGDRETFKHYQSRCQLM